MTSNNDGGGVGGDNRLGYDTTITLAPSPVRRSRPHPPLQPQEQPTFVARAAIGVQQQQQQQNPPPELQSTDFNNFHGHSSSPSFSSLPPTPLWELQLRSGGKKGQHFTFPDDSQQQPPTTTTR